MEVFKILGRIAVSNEEANKKIEETGDKAEKTSSKMGSVFGNIGKFALKAAKVAVVATTAIATGIAGITAKAVNEYADYEQLVGGVETLFDKTKKILQDEDGQSIYQIRFPKPCIIYLSNVSEYVPDTYSLSVDLGLDAPISYRVPVVKLMNCSAEDINNRKMVILVPFFLLKLRERLRNKKYRTPENIASLKSLIKTDIMGSIDKNIGLGNITLEDGAQLYKLTQVLYTKLYSYYEETEEVTDMVDQSIVTFVDEFQEQKAKLEQEIADRDKKIVDRDKKIADRDKKIADRDKKIADKDKELADRNHELADKEKKLAAQKAEGDAIIAKLQAEIEELKKKR